MKKLINIVLLMAAVFVLLPATKASADMGPKPSVVIDFSGLEEEIYYVTLLAEDEPWGPWEIDEEPYGSSEEIFVYQKFCEYKNTDGYYFWDYIEECSDDDCFEWTYYPPDKFKVLIYFPVYNLFLISDEAYERYAFDSYFTATVSGAEELNVLSDMEAVSIQMNPSYDFLPELKSLAARIVITILLEIVITLLMGYRDKKSLILITVMNVFTQVILNVLLNIVNYQSGHYAFLSYYLRMECIVLVIEAAVYGWFLRNKNSITDKKYMPYLYAAVANGASYFIGVWLAKIIPGIF